mmetsp:Transcript_50803/g.99912  ORF Transcript_50803/g.99912 Transcript_50803/m.99912 type:complete len:219 (-) Transcript_50803:682-1338(-)
MGSRSLADCHLISPDRREVPHEVDKLASAGNGPRVRIHETSLGRSLIESARTEDLPRKQGPQLLSPSRSLVCEEDRREFLHLVAPTHRDPPHLVVHHLFFLLPLLLQLRPLLPAGALRMRLRRCRMGKSHGSKPFTFPGGCQHRLLLLLVDSRHAHHSRCGSPQRTLERKGETCRSLYTCTLRGHSVRSEQGGSREDGSCRLGSCFCFCDFGGTHRRR